MSIEELFSGIGVVIDDKVFDINEPGQDRIVSIVNYLENEKHFPLLKYDHFPGDDVLSNLVNISFLLLDWEIDPRESVVGDDGMNVSLGGAWKAENERRVIEIVKIVLKNCLAPVFIFSNIDKDSIIRKLSEAEIDLGERQVFVKPKAELINDEVLFRSIERWVDSVSGVYVAKQWEISFNKAKNQFFSEMANNTSHWPKALFNAAEEDSTDPGEEITQTIAQNIVSRMMPIAIDQEQIDKDTSVPGADEVMSIMKGQFFLDNGSDSSMVGDFYKKSGKYYMNIRPTCDCITGREQSDGKVYLLKCSRLTDNQVFQFYNADDGHFKETIRCAIVGPLFEKKVYRIDFNKIIIDDYSNWQQNKKGRILPPVINHITERYGLYVQRQALPRIPKGIIPTMPLDDSSSSGKSIDNQHKGSLPSLFTCGRKK